MTPLKIVNSYPRDCKRHVEIFSSLQPEAPWCRSTQSYCVIAHFVESSDEKSPITPIFLFVSSSP